MIYFSRRLRKEMSEDDAYEKWHEEKHYVLHDELAERKVDFHAALFRDETCYEFHDDRNGE